VLATATGLHAYATNTRRQDQRLNVRISRSSNGVDWAAPTEAKPVTPAWAARDEPDHWARTMG
jgi:hypothetical protein